MTDELKPTPQEQKDMDAQFAHALESNPMLQRCMDEVEEAYIKAMVESESDEEGVRNRCHAMIHATRRLRNHIQEYVNTGKLDRKRVKNNAAGIR